MNLRYSTRALVDMDVNAERIQENSTRSALRFLEAVEKTAKGLILLPELSAGYETDDSELQELRGLLVAGFEKYLLFYRIKGEDVIVAWILHGHRNLSEALKE